MLKRCEGCLRLLPWHYPASYCPECLEEIESADLSLQPIYFEVLARFIIM